MHESQERVDHCRHGWQFCLAECRDDVARHVEIEGALGRHAAGDAGEQRRLTGGEFSGTHACLLPSVTTATGEAALGATDAGGRTPNPTHASALVSGATQLSLPSTALRSDSCASIVERRRDGSQGFLVTGGVAQTFEGRSRSEHLRDDTAALRCSQTPVALRCIEALLAHAEAA